MVLLLSLLPLSVFAATNTSNALMSAADLYKAFFIDGNAEKQFLHPLCNCLYIQTDPNFRTVCYQQLSSLCAANIVKKGHINAEEACEEFKKPLVDGLAMGLAGGSIGLAFDMCKTTTESTAAEFSEYFESHGMFPSLVKGLRGSGIIGSDLAFLSSDELLGLGVNIGDVKGFGHMQQSFLQRKLPLDIRPRASLKSDSEIDLTVYIENIWDVDELAFSFKASFSLLYSWTDRQMWQSCLATDDACDQGVCGATWRPEVTFPNARSEVPSPYYRYLQTDAKSRSGTYFARYFGEFQAPMSFKGYPWDYQELAIELRLQDFYPPSRILFNPVRTIAQETNTSAAAKDVVSGWTVKNPKATVITRDPVPLPPKITADDIPDMLAKQEPLAYTIQRKVWYMGSTEGHITTAVASLEIWRGGNFYVLNYVLCAFVLTFLSFVVYLMDETEVSNRCALALTIIVALNVFQIILNVEIPKTNYLTPLHTFYLVSVLLCAIAAAQSIVMYKIQTSYDKTIAEIKRKKKEASTLEHQSKDFEEGGAKLEGPESSVVYPEAFGEKKIDTEGKKENETKKKRVVSPKSRVETAKKDQKEIDVTAHGRTLMVQHWMLTYFDRICFVIVSIFYLIFSLVVVMVPRDPVIESSY